jgi:hypothetical protein
MQITLLIHSFDSTMHQESADSTIQVYVLLELGEQKLFHIKAFRPM